MKRLLLLTLCLAPCAPAQEPAKNDPFAEKRRQMAAAVAFSPLAPRESAPTPAKPAKAEPVSLARPSCQADVAGREFDVVVIGGTSGGIMAAVRAAREGLSVLLVEHTGHLGGMMTNGLMQWDALFGGPRAPLFTELLKNIERHYVTKFGENSADHQRMRYTHEHYPVGWVEPHVAEREYNRLVAGEKKLTLLLHHYPVAFERRERLLGAVTLRAYGGAQEVQVRGRTYIDATYEGDLLPLAKVKYRAGREARDEYGEPHAGKVFANLDKTPAPRDAVEARLNIRPYSQSQGSLDPASPYSADGAVQAYNYRFCVTNDPANRLMLTQPPAGYRREEYLNYDRKSIASNPGVNHKSHMNSPILPGENHAYPEGDWATREKITQRHLDFTLGLIWFLQNDASIKPAQREQYRQWGLPADEFVDHGHVPYEMYVRETRRLVGRHVCREQDFSLAPGLGRTPIMADSIAVTDWYMDSHSCTTESRPGFRYDGKLILTEESRPAQIPYRALLPQEVDNLLVPVCLAATHIAWGAVRLEPVFMQTGEAAGLAAAMAAQSRRTPGTLPGEAVSRALAQRGCLVAFFNDLKVGDERSPAVTAAQTLGPKGFFANYDARLAEPLKTSTAQVWAQALRRMDQKPYDAGETARQVAQAEAADSPPISAPAFGALLPSLVVLDSSAPFQRGTALSLLKDALPAP